MSIRSVNAAAPQIVANAKQVKKPVVDVAKTIKESTGINPNTRMLAAIQGALKELNLA